MKNDRIDKNYCDNIPFMIKSYHQETKTQESKTDSKKTNNKRKSIGGYYDGNDK